MSCDIATWLQLALPVLEHWPVRKEMVQGTTHLRSKDSYQAQSRRLLERCSRSEPTTRMRELASAWWPECERVLSISVVIGCEGDSRLVN
jgi:hypothetical protein